MFKEYFAKKMMERELAKQGVSSADQEKFLSIINSNPDLFKKIAEEAQAEMKKGKGQMEAIMSVARKYQDELRKLQK